MIPFTSLLIISVLLSQPHKYRLSTEDLHKRRNLRLLRFQVSKERPIILMAYLTKDYVNFCLFYINFSCLENAVYKSIFKSGFFCLLSIFVELTIL